MAIGILKAGVNSQDVTASTGTDVVDTVNYVYEYADGYSSDTTVTVGSGGDYATINEALTYLHKKSKEYESGNPLVTINLLTGFEMAEQVICDGINLGWVRITSDDAEVTIIRSALLETNIENLDYTSKPAFLAVNSGALPKISALFTMDSSGTSSEKHGVMCAWDGFVHVDLGCGVKNAGSRGLYLVGARAFARDTIWSGAGERGIRIGNGSIATIRGSTATGCGEYNLAIDGASIVSAQECDFSSGLGSANINISGASNVKLDDSLSTDATGYGLEIKDSSTVSAKNIALDRAGNRGAIITASTLECASATAADCVNAAISLAQGASVNAQSMICTGSLGTNAVICSTGSRMNFKNGTASSVASAIAISEGSHINATGATGSTNTAVNTLTNKGVIYQ